mmetsp:Transcript_43659/g.113799  ORF Transcript_43659/g.113799 Transcript_43659/m.113799 type:complete len:120 (+) Transcript_43659:2525-2884(+)
MRVHLLRFPLLPCFPSPHFLCFSLHLTPILRRSDQTRAAALTQSEVETLKASLMSEQERVSQLEGEVERMVEKGMGREAKRVGKECQTDVDLSALYRSVAEQAVKKAVGRAVAVACLHA